MNAHFGLRQQGEIVVLQSARSVHEVQARRDGEAGDEVVIQPPAKVIPLKAVLFHLEAGGLVGVVAESEGVEKDLVEVMTVAVQGIDSQAAAEQADAAAIVDIGAVLIEVAGTE